MKHRLTRRQFLAGAAAVPLFGVARTLAADRRPNFVFILTDDQRWDAMSCAGHPFLFTPNMDRIAKEGARFANAFVTTSLCSPSRASFLTGRYAHNHGVIDNTRGLNPSVPTFPQILQKAGYDTALIGKWHMSLQDGPQPGFNRWVSFPGQGVYHDPTLNVDGRKVERNGYITDILTDYALDWLRKPRNTPFCLYLSHKAAHVDFVPAVRHSKLFSDVEITPPKSMYEPDEGKPKWVTDIRRGWDDPEIRGEDENKIRNYCRTLVAVDESVGRVLDELDRTGVAEDTVVVFAGDNGFFLGEHGLRDKRAMYEESIRIPLLMRYPRLVRPGSVIEPMALNIDICPTFLELAGIESPAGVDGRSLRPILSGGSRGWRTDFYYEYFWEAEAKRRPTISGVRTERWKYITYPDSDNTPELYDLINDPLEMRNAIDDRSAGAVQSHLRARLAQLQPDTASK